MLEDVRKHSHLPPHLKIKRILDNLHVDGNTPDSSELTLKPNEARPLRGQISTFLKMGDGSNNELKNILARAEHIAHNAEFSNLGSHKSTTHMTEKDIEDIANSASQFTSIVDALLQIP
ncbi:MAG: hypothetical protein HXO72_01390 [Scardovia wiggsiae]|nr:hypothetical protein [Scardovia wiggsiae]